MLSSQFIRHGRIHIRVPDSQFACQTMPLTAVVRQLKRKNPLTARLTSLSFLCCDLGRGCSISQFRGQISA